MAVSLLTRPPVDLRRTRQSVGVLFGLLGATAGSWAARIPDVRDQLTGVTDARWGLLNVSSTLGSLVSLTLVLAVAGRFGPRRLALGGAVLLLANAPLMAASSSAVALVAGLLANGFASNLLAASMNAQAVQVERSYARRIMSSFHAMFSLGQLAGGVLGTLAAGQHLSPFAQLATTSSVLGLALLMTFRQLPQDVPVPPVKTRMPLRRRLCPQLLLLAVIALLASLNEGSAVQWSALYTSSALAAGATAGAATFSCFSISMTASRLFGDRILHRIGARAFLTFSSLISAAGMTVALGIGTPVAAFAGYALLGIGSGCVIPTVYGLAGNQPNLTATEGVSVAALGQWPAFLLGPPIIGAIAGLVGLRCALLLAVASSLTIAALSRRLAASPERHPGKELASSSV
jgi:MFS family permease